MQTKYPIAGYMGKVLKVDLTTRQISVANLDTQLAKNYIGGSGIGTKLVFDHFMDLADKYDNPFKDMDPLSDDNILAFCTGPLTATKTPAASRHNINFKSPLTNTIGSCSAGGQWGVSFKKTGFDALVVTGAAKKPVYLYISDKGQTLQDRVKIIEAEQYIGWDAHAITDKLQDIHTTRSKVLAIGQAGQNKARIACIKSDKHRSLGRGGPGAVMGSKNLLAIVVDGSLPVPIHNADAMKLKNKGGPNYHAMKKIKATPSTNEGYKILGTAGTIRLIDLYEMLPHHNFQDTTHDRDSIRSISGESLREQILTSTRACYGCPISCGRVTRVADKTGEGPEYETIGLIGANLGIYDLKVIAKANYLCNEYGIDTMSFGGTIATAMEMFEKGYITIKDTDGIELRFGNADILEQLVELTAKRKGFGDKLAEGSLNLAKMFGHPECSMTIKGMEIPAYDSRTSIAQALGFMVSARGACHLHGGFSVMLGFFAGYGEVPRFQEEGVPQVVINQQDAGMVADITGVCRFIGFAVTVDEIADIINAVTGWKISSYDFEVICQRIHTLERLFNTLAGLNPGDDKLPERFYTESILIEGKNRICDRQLFDRLLSEYYDLRGWEKNGIPTTKILTELDIKLNIKQLQKTGIEITDGS